MKVRILTYNIFCRPSLVARHLKGDFKKKRIEVFTDKFLDQYDILGFQEFFRSFGKKQKKFLETAKEHGFAYSCQCPAPPPFGYLVDGGLLVVSRFPIVESELRLYPPGHEGDRPPAKGVMYTKISLAHSGSPDSFIHLFTTHLHASYDKNPPEYYKALRQSQLLILRDFVCSKVSGSSWPVVVMGDLNSNGRVSPEDGSDSQEYIEMIRILSGPGLFQVEDLLKISKGTHPVTQGGVKLDEHGEMVADEEYLAEERALCQRKRLDYILVFRPLLGNSSRASDEMIASSTRQYSKLVQYSRSVSSEPPPTSSLLTSASSSLTPPASVPCVWRVEPDSTKVQYFKTDSVEYINQLSDHYGVTSVICFGENEV